MTHPRKFAELWHQLAWKFSRRAVEASTAAEVERCGRLSLRARARVGDALKRWGELEG